MNALTEEERRFAAENHRLITAFLIRKRLRADEYYAIAALGYLGAVQRYLSEPALRRLAFSTVAERAMRRSVFHSQRAQFGRRRRICTVSLETGGPCGGPLYKACGFGPDRQVEDRLLLQALFENLTSQQFDVIQLRLAGYRLREIAAIKGISEKRVRTLLAKAKRPIEELCRP